MNVLHQNNTFPFQPWKPDLGRVYTSGYSFDSETTLIDDLHPWLTPAYVLVLSSMAGRDISFDANTRPSSSPPTQTFPS